MFDWLVIGGGIHGVHIAARLLGEARVAPERLCILDPGAELLERWKVCTATTGMTHLRSPSVHHVDIDPWSLERFAGVPRRRAPGLFAPPYDRPSLGLFNAHCDQVIETYGLKALHLRGRAEHIALHCDRAVVRTRAGEELRAACIVLAIGMGDQPAWPAWAKAAGDSRIRHVFDAGFTLEDGVAWERVIVVGGGISAAEIALRLADGRRSVHVVCRHALREHPFDSDPGWLGPKLMRGFAREVDPDRRRARIREARHRGSVPPAILRAFRDAIDQGAVRWHRAEVEALERSGDWLGLRLSSRALLQADQVLLATGFETRRPGGALLDGLAEEAALPCATCGYPLVDRHLRWHPRVYATGPLAELELGPAARNIAGARRAGDRIVAARQEWA
jgi:cation diffusion facilitator CzcD-associated flavoprotein CzcO